MKTYRAKRATWILFAAFTLSTLGGGDYRPTITGEVFAGPRHKTSKKIEPKRERTASRKKVRENVRRKPKKFKLKGSWRKKRLPKPGKVSLRPKDAKKLNRTTKSVKSSLKSYTFTKAGVENARNRKKDYHDPYKKGTTAITRTTRKPEQFVRVFKPGKNGPAGLWLMKARDIHGLTPQAIKRKFALQYVPTHYVHITVPPNTRMTVGIAGRQKSKNSVKHTLGGGIQYELRPRRRGAHIDLKISKPAPIGRRVSINKKQR